MTPILELENLCKYYTSATNVVVGLNMINLSFYEGEFVAVTGESGSGKSTLSHVISGLLPFESGEMFVHGVPTSQFDSEERENYRRDEISFISQDYGILTGCTVMENVISALVLSGLERSAAKQRASEILKQVELQDLVNRKAGKLSSGQKQRLSIARALAKPSKILVADEPTGNLDSENSKQIVKLLASTAKDHLVIMVTHDYEEVEAFVTRHIVLKDGTIVQDTPLSAPNSNRTESVRRDKKQKLASYVALLQLDAKPMWSILLLLMFTLSAFGVFAFLGSYIVALDDTSTRVYDNTAFRNGDKNRIIVGKIDGAPLDDTDYSTFLAVDNVAGLERFGYLADMNYAYRQDIDYRVRYSMKQGTGEGDREYKDGVTFEKTELFAKTIPMKTKSQDFLRTGRLPENLYEVVMAGPDDLLGTTFPVFIQNRQKWSTSHYIRLDVTVVGTTSEGTGLYFHDDLGRIMVISLFLEDHSQPIIFAPQYGTDMEGLVYVSESMLSKLQRDKKWDGKLHLLFGNESVVLDVAGTHDSTYVNYLLVSDEVFRIAVNQENHNQASLQITDYAYTDRVVDELQQKGYIALSPFQQGATKQNSVLAKQRMQTLKLCLGAFFVCLVLQIVVLKGMFSVQQENYRLLANIGLLNRTAKNSIRVQHILLCIFGQLLSIGCIYLCWKLQIKQIVQVVYYLPVDKIAILSLTHFVGCMVSSEWVCKDLTRKVFPFGSVFRDLPGKEE